MGGALFSKSLIQFSVDGWGCVPSLLFDLRPNYGGGDEDKGTSFNRSHACTAALSAPDPAAGHRQPTPPLKTPGHSQASLAQSLVGSLLLSPGSWCTQGFILSSKSLFETGEPCVSPVIKSRWPSKSSFVGVLSPFARSSGWYICCGS